MTNEDKTQAGKKFIYTIFPQTSEEDVIAKLKGHLGLYERYQNMRTDWRQKFMNYMTGKASLPLTYDPFFKRLFDPDLHPERLSGLLSSIIGEEVTVERILPTENRIFQYPSLLIMDIVVRLNDGSLADVEIQKVPYAFAGERMSCYSSDLLLRQYTRMKSEKGAEFTYRDMKKVYTIVMYEKTPASFKNDTPDSAYLFRGSTEFTPHININLLQEYYIVALDEFSKNKYSEPNSKTNAWLSLLTAVDMDDLDRTLSRYSWLEEICRDMAEYLSKPEEVFDMFSEALQILDRNTVQYMVDVMSEEIDKQKATIAEQNNAIAEQNSTIAEQNSTIDMQAAALAEKDSEIKRLCEQLAKATKD